MVPRTGSVVDRAFVLPGVARSREQAVPAWPGAGLAGPRGRRTSCGPTSPVLNLTPARAPDRLVAEHHAGLGASWPCPSGIPGAAARGASGGRWSARCARRVRCVRCRYACTPSSTGSSSSVCVATTRTDRPWITSRLCRWAGIRRRGGTFARLTSGATRVGVRVSSASRVLVHATGHRWTCLDERAGQPLF